MQSKGLRRFRTLMSQARQREGDKSHLEELSLSNGFIEFIWRYRQAFNQIERVPLFIKRESEKELKLNGILTTKREAVRSIEGRLSWNKRTFERRSGKRRYFGSHFIGFNPNEIVEKPDVSRRGWSIWVREHRRFSFKQQGKWQRQRSPPSFVREVEAASNGARTRVAYEHNDFKLISRSDNRQISDH